MHRRILRRSALSVVLLAALIFPLFAYAQEPPPAPLLAESIRRDLSKAQLVLQENPAAAQQLLEQAQRSYTDSLGPQFATAANEANQQVQSGFAAAELARSANDSVGFAAARSDIWMALLAGSYRITEQALLSGDGKTAQAWLPLREFRTATRFSRPNADATLAIADFVAGRTTATHALSVFQADLLDTYQARLTEALHDLTAADQQQYRTRRAEFAVFAQGYFALLAPAYGTQRGADAQMIALRSFDELRAAALAGQPIQAPFNQIEQMLEGFRAAPLSTAEQTRRAGQMLRFLSLVAIEYDRGVSGTTVIKDLEIREAITFQAGAAAAFADLRPTLAQRDPILTKQISAQFALLDAQLQSSATAQQVVAPGVVQATTDQLLALLTQIMPAEWQTYDSSADFDVIQTALDQMIAAAEVGQYELAESARLEAYAILESGPEAKLIAFAPQYKPILEDLFWYGQTERPGLAYLIQQRAPVSEIKASRSALNAQLAEAQRALAGNNAPVAVASNAAILVFREGLEAILILASLMGSFKIGEQRKYRKPLWVGAGLAFLASALTWLLAREVLTSLARYGERLEAIVGLIAIGVLLLITNWFFHDMYWKDWMASFHQQKSRLLIGGITGQFIGLAVLGFTSVYREGFETVLFLQALVLESGSVTVLSGVGAGLVLTVLVGLLVFAVQAKLPHKKMLIFTGVMIGVVLLQMVGHTAHVFQVVGWLPTSPIRALLPYTPYWVGLWFGMYATWEGLLLQFLAGAFTIGSYFLAEHLHKRNAPVAKGKIERRTVG